ncbi:MAG: hypothetical protein AB7N76_31490 [Planctomycetota bacterium]
MRARTTALIALALGAAWLGVSGCGWEERLDAPPPRAVRVAAWAQGAPVGSCAPLTSGAATRLLARPGLGINLSPVTPYASQWVYVDAFRASRLGRDPEWMLSGSGAPPALDAQGYPRGLASGQRARTLCLYGTEGDYPAGEYTLSFRGVGAVELGRDAEHCLLEHDGRGEARARVLVRPTRRGISLTIVRSAPSDPVRDLHLVMPGFAASYRARPFHPLFLARLRPFACLRFMDWTATNSSPVARWSERRPPDYRSQHREVAWEDVLALCNALERPPWLCVPHRADQDYLRSLAELVRARLDPRLPVLVEYSNEVWNGQFRQQREVAAAARARGAPWEEEYARRAAAAFEAFRAALGPARVLRVVSGQAANVGVAKHILAALPPGGADALAIAPYFSAGREVNRDPALSAGWSSADLLRACRRDLERVRAMIVAHRALAARYGLALVAYEGGQHLVGRGGARDDLGLQARFLAANRDPGMRALYREYLALWEAEGGGLFCHYASCEQPDRSGDWGALESLRRGDAPKYRALLDTVQEWERAALRTPGGESAPPARPTPQQR